MVNNVRVLVQKLTDLSDLETKIAFGMFFSLKILFGSLKTEDDDTFEDVILIE